MNLTKTQCRQIRGVIGKMMQGPALRVQNSTLPVNAKRYIEDDMQTQYKYWAATYVMNELNGMLPEHEKVNFSKPT